MNEPSISRRQKPSQTERPSPTHKEWRTTLLDRASFLVAVLMLTAIVLGYGSLQSDVFTLDEFNVNTTAAMTLMLAATGQTIVLIRGGIDLSIGGMISLGTVIAATQFGQDPANVALWIFIILAIGATAGAINGVLITILKLQPFLVTLATWSILNGAAMLILPTDGGSVPGWWVSLGYSRIFGLGASIWLLFGLLVFWLWFSASRFGTTIKATGSNERSAQLSGVSIMRINVLAYGLSGVFAAAAALYLTTQIGSGSPTIGKDYILPSVAAAVIGGVSLFGGRGHLAGTVVGAYILTLIGSLVFVLRVSSFWQPVATGVILLFAVLASSITEKATRKNDQ